MKAATAGMSTATTSIPLSKRFFPGLRPILGNETYDLVLVRYRDLYGNHERPENPQLRWHLVEGILPGLALYQILRERGASPDDALQKVDRVLGELFSNDARQMRLVGRLPFALLVLRLFLKSFMSKYPAEGWTIDWKQNDRNGIRFDMRSCFYQATLAKCGAPELTASFCRVDDLLYSQLSRYVSWQRTMTIAGGSATCDFCFASTKMTSREKPGDWSVARENGVER